MAKKKTEEEKKPAAEKKAAPAKKTAAKKEKSDAKAGAAPRHPAGRVKSAHGSKDDLVKKIVEPLAAADQDTDALADRLRKASNAQLLRLLRVVETVKEKYGNKDKLIATLGKLLGKAKDKDYLAKLGTFSLPRLLDMVRSAERRARS